MVKTFKFTFKETDKLKGVWISSLGMPYAIERKFGLAGIKSLKDVIDNWDHFDSIDGIGHKYISNIKAATFAYLMEKGLVTNCSVS